MEKRTPPDWMTEEQQSLWKKAFDNPRKKKSQSGANALTEAVITYCRAIGCATARINTTGIYDEKLQRYRFSGATKGVEDIDVTLPVVINGKKVGLKIAVEVKYGKDRQSEDQKKRQEALNKSGAYYIIAKTFDEFKKDIDNIVYSYAET